MVMGDRIKPGAVPAVAKVKKTASAAVRDRSPDADTRTGQVTANGEPAGDKAAAASRDPLIP